MGGASSRRLRFEGVRTAHVPVCKPTVRHCMLGGGLLVLQWLLS